jgi:2-polyprenyl-3-methyl-5-hydroxy-6-metoxy-1,4-benzoquinol methylase
MVTTHRFTTAYSYNAIPIHAARGVHELCEELVASRLQPGASLLDVGCGSGALSARLTDRGYRIVATDLNLDAFHAAVPAVQWDASDLATAPVGTASLDGVCCIEVLEHVENPLGTLANLAALVKPGGYLFLSTPNVGHIRSRLKFLMSGAPSYFGPHEYYGSGHRTILPDWLLKLHVESVGLPVVQMVYAGTADMSPLQAFMMPALQWIGRVLLRIPRPASGDGIVTFLVAQVPAR